MLTPLEGGGDRSRGNNSIDCPIDGEVSVSAKTRFVIDDETLGDLNVDDLNDGVLTRVAPRAATGARRLQAAAAATLVLAVGACAAQLSVTQRGDARGASAGAGAPSSRSNVPPQVIGVAAGDGGRHSTTGRGRGERR